VTPAEARAISTRSFKTTLTDGDWTNLLNGADGFMYRYAFSKNTTSKQKSYLGYNTGDPNYTDDMKRACVLIAENLYLFTLSQQAATGGMTKESIDDYSYELNVLKALALNANAVLNLVSGEAKEILDFYRVADSDDSISQRSACRSGSEEIFINKHPIDPGSYYNPSKYKPPLVFP